MLWERTSKVGRPRPRCLAAELGAD